MWLRKISPKGVYVRYGDYVIYDNTIPIIDNLFPRARRKNNKPDYELNSITAIKKNVKDQDRVLIVGGGHGITGIAASVCGFRPVAATMAEK